MIVGVLQFELRIHGAASLKDKRRVVRSVRDKLHREHLVSVAEVGALPIWNSAVMAVACVAGDRPRVLDVFDAIEHKLRALREAELVECQRDLFGPNDLPSDGQSDEEE